MLKLIVILSLLFSCNSKDQLVEVKIVDPVRHYYPIVQGQKLKIIIELENKSDFPFKISDILTSCGCVMVKNGENVVIPAESSAYLEFVYNSNKNIGEVNHFIYIYGNLKKGIKLEANFEVHVVPDALYTPDYEELYRRDVEKNGETKIIEEGSENEKGYYISLEDGNK